MSTSLRSRKTSKPSLTRRAMISGPEAMNSSWPTLATPNHGRSSFASWMAATASSTSSANARCRRTASASTLPGSNPARTSAMCRSDQLVQRLYSMLLAPGPELVEHARRSSRSIERSGPHLDGVGTRHQQFDGVDAVRHPTGSDDRHVGKLLADVEDGPDGDRTDR